MVNNTLLWDSDLYIYTHHTHRHPNLHSTHFSRIKEESGNFFSISVLSSFWRRSHFLFFHFYIVCHQYPHSCNYYYDYYFILLLLFLLLYQVYVSVYNARVWCYCYHSRACDYQPETRGFLLVTLTIKNAYYTMCVAIFKRNTHSIITY